MRLIYIAGPYRAPTEYATLQNLRRAEALAVRIWRAGAVAICPHLNTAHLGGAVPDDVWLAGDLEILKRCDAVAAVDGWERSQGARGEVELARERRIPTFERFEELAAWLENAGMSKVMPARPDAIAGLL